MFSRNSKLKAYIRNAYKILVTAPEGKRRFGRLKCTQMDNITADLKK